MRSLNLAKTGINKIRSHQLELKASDFEDSVKSLPPGEWCIMKESAKDYWVGFVNPRIEDKYSCAQLVTKLPLETISSFSPEKFITDKLLLASMKRTLFKGYGKNSRIFYGVSDGLPGLIIDQFENATIVQINVAGIDRFRDLIKKVVEENTKTKVYFLDNPKYREKEGLPVFDNDPLPDLLVDENGIKFKVRSQVLQKVGFYYDHRENRHHLVNLISRLTTKPKNGIDLFSYAGAWGLAALKASCEKMTFVDQGDFEAEIEEGLKLNSQEGKGKFVRGDVFKFLDESFQKKQLFDLVLCDPPAFAKSALQKPQALEGYSKLHRKVFKIISNGGLAAFSSCTHYVGHEEFQKNILDAAYREDRKIQLVYCGMQGFDHPIRSLEDRSNYIKSYFYIVE